MHAHIGVHMYEVVSGTICCDLVYLVYLLSRYLGDLGEMKKMSLLFLGLTFLRSYTTRQVLG